jgi:soluble lytic murein transglycosylase-like protein
MRLGTYLGIFGTLFGNALVAVVLYLITTGTTYQTPTFLPTSPQATPEASENLNQTGDDVNEQAASVSEEPNSEPCEVSNEYPDRVLRWCGLITHYANERGLEPDLVAALILQESGGNPEAYSSSGAVGLMQIMPRDGIAAGFTCVNGPCFSNRPSTSELQDPEYNIAYGTKMLASLEKKYKSTREALKAYGPMDMGYGYADIVLAHYQRFSN